MGIENALVRRMPRTVVKGHKNQKDGKPRDVFEGMERVDAIDSLSLLESGNADGGSTLMYVDRL